MEKVLTKEEWKRRKRNQRYIRFGIACFTALLLFVLLIMGLKAVFSALFSSEDKLSAVAASIQEQFTVIDKPLKNAKDTRTGIKLEAVKGIVIHYIGMPGQDAEERYDYFAETDSSLAAKGSTHYIIDFDGSIIRCIPETEIALASGDLNLECISIEYAHNDIYGEPESETYDSMVLLTAFLVEKYDLELSSVKLHSDITEKGSDCPPYFTEDEEKWNAFLEAVEDAIAAAETAE